MTGYQKLKAAVEKDCSCGCFNPEGCDKPNGTFGKNRCFHKYCDRFAWIVARAKHYAEKTGLEWEELLTKWEGRRNCWYMNYYQDVDFPRLEGEKVRVFDTCEELQEAVGNAAFRCPACGGVSSDPYECNSLAEKDGKPCDWKVYGLFRDLGRGVFVFCRDELRGHLIFMPLAWEQK